MVHVPAATTVTVLPLTVQMVVVVEVNVTGSPDDAVALIVNGATPSVTLAIAGNVMVCVAPEEIVTLNDCVASGGVPLVAVSEPR